ncbi:MAG: hypothetical protein VKN72_03895 [Nostocales cyanobacterium 94392]|nr:hypothetical protein [Nostocales cyanobacterium 94392]
MHYLAFNKAWFEKHQNKLLWFLKYSFFRKILQIQTDKPIVKIEPNAYTVYLGKDEVYHFQTDFRTHWKYSKRLYYAFKPLWWTMHIWDLFADVYVPKLSFGFDTLTAYPDPHPETTTVDGIVYRDVVNESWATIRGATGNGFTDDSTTHNACRIQSGTSSFNNITRYICLFDTSTLTSNASITAATLSLRGSSKFNDWSISDWTLNIFTSNPASNTGLSNSDFTTLGTTPQCDTAITYSSWLTSGYNDFSLNSTGLGNISKTGVSKFGTRESTYDAPNSTPTHASSKTAEFGLRSADYTGTSDDPKLVVTYTLASPIRLLTLLGVGK